MGESETETVAIPRWSPNGRRNGDRPETWKMLGLIFTLVSLIFTAGYNYRRVEETATGLVTESSAREAFVREVKENYVRRDVQEQQLRLIDSRLQEIRDLMQRYEEARRREGR